MVLHIEISPDSMRMDPETLLAGYSSLFYFINMFGFCGSLIESIKEFCMHNLGQGPAI